jgi:hypothetical protein
MIRCKQKTSRAIRPSLVWSRNFIREQLVMFSNSELFASSSYRLCRNLHFISKSDLKTGMLYIGQASLASHDLAVVAAKRHVYGM